MAARLSQVGGSTSEPPPSAPSFSLWNQRTMHVLVGAGICAVGFTVIYHWLQAKPQAKPPSFNDEERKFMEAQHISLLRFRAQIAINEAKDLGFKKYAEGIIVFEASTFDLKETDDFFIRCSRPLRNPQLEPPFFEQKTKTGQELEFFIPNLPCKQEILLSFGTSRWEKTKILKIDQVRGLYTVSYDNNEIIIKSTALAEPTVYRPSGQDTALKRFRLLTLTEGGHYKISTQLEPGPLVIENSDHRSVVYLQINTYKKSISPTHRALVIPLLISAGKTKIVSLDLLTELWRTTYKWATGKTALDGDLELHLTGVQRIVYPERPVTLPQS